jgi:RNA 3'-terminal phosphate cyclase (ATP)
VIDIEPVQRLGEIHVLERGPQRSRCARALVSNLPQHVAEREMHVVRRRLNWAEGDAEIVAISGSPGPGNVVIIELEYENVTEVFTSCGEVGRPAEAVAMHAVQQCQRYMKGIAPVGEYLTDQLMLPLAIAGCGSFLSTGLSLHSQTHVALIGKFLGSAVVTCEKADDGTLMRFTK